MKFGKETIICVMVITKSIEHGVGGDEGRFFGQNVVIIYPWLLAANPSYFQHSAVDGSAYSNGQLPSHFFLSQPEAINRTLQQSRGSLDLDDVLKNSAGWDDGKVQTLFEKDLHCEKLLIWAGGSCKDSIESCLCAMLLTSSTGMRRWLTGLGSRTIRYARIQSTVFVSS